VPAGKFDGVAALGSEREKIVMADDTGIVLVDVGILFV
jgi:hypothetical protein